MLKELSWLKRRFRGLALHRSMLNMLWGNRQHFVSFDLTFNVQVACLHLGTNQRPPTYSQTILEQDLKQVEVERNSPRPAEEKTFCQRRCGGSDEQWQSWGSVCSAWCGEWKKSWWAWLLHTKKSFQHFSIELLEDCKEKTEAAPLQVEKAPEASSRKCCEEACCLWAACCKVSFAINERNFNTNYPGQGTFSRIWLWRTKHGSPWVAMSSTGKIFQLKDFSLIFTI